MPIHTFGSRAAERSPDGSCRRHTGGACARLLHEYGLTVVDPFLNCRVRTPGVSATLVETAGREAANVVSEDPESPPSVETRAMEPRGSLAG